MLDVPKKLALSSLPGLDRKTSSISPTAASSKQTKATMEVPQLKATQSSFGFGKESKPETKASAFAAAVTDKLTSSSASPADD